jgi:hypothetical protein
MIVSEEGIKRGWTGGAGFKLRGAIPWIAAQHRREIVILTAISGPYSPDCCRWSWRRNNFSEATGRFVLH